MSRKEIKLEELVEVLCPFGFADLPKGHILPWIKWSL